MVRLQVTPHPFFPIFIFLYKRRRNLSAILANKPPPNIYIIQPPKMYTIVGVGRNIINLFLN